MSCSLLFFGGGWGGGNATGIMKIRFWMWQCANGFNFVDLLWFSEVILWTHLSTSQPKNGQSSSTLWILSVIWSLSVTNHLKDDEKQPRRCRSNGQNQWAVCMILWLHASAKSKAAPRCCWSSPRPKKAGGRSCPLWFCGTNPASKLLRTKNISCSLLFFGGGWGGGNATVLVEIRFWMWQCANGFNFVDLLWFSELILWIHMSTSQPKIWPIIINPMNLSVSLSLFFTKHL